MIETIKDEIKKLMPVYDPGTHIGEIKTAYAVVVDMGVKEQEGTKGLLGQRIIEIVVIVPLKNQGELERHIKGIKKSLKPIKNLKFTGSAESSNILQEYKGAAKSMIYRQPVRT